LELEAGVVVEELVLCDSGDEVVEGE